MYQLTIDHDRQPGSVSGHADFTDAHQFLLVGADPYLRPVRNTVETLHHNAIHNSDVSSCPPAIAASVQQLLIAGTTKDQVAVLSWYYTVLLWAVSTP